MKIIHTRDLESTQITQISSVCATSTKDINDIVHEGSSVSFSRRWCMSIACQFAPHVSCCVKHPNVVVMMLTVRATEPGIMIPLIGQSANKLINAYNMILSAYATQMCSVRRAGFREPSDGFTNSQPALVLTKVQHPSRVISEID